MSPTSVKRVAARAIREDQEARQNMMADSFQNFAARLGIGTDNLSSDVTYGFNPITRIRNLCEWIYRGSLLGPIAIDLVADDMTREGVSIKGTLEPDAIQQLDAKAIEIGLWESINESIKWSRMYGGCLGVFLIDGQKPNTPFRVESVGKGDFRGILPMDRWMVEPSLQDLVQTEAGQLATGPNLGVPKYYSVRAEAPAFRNTTIHHSRCMRLLGVKLPWWQAIQENLWGLSVFERLYERGTYLDSATSGAAQLIYKAHLRVIKYKGFRQLLGENQVGTETLFRAMQMLSKFQASEGITLIDADDEFQSITPGAFSGIADAVLLFLQQISGILQIPLTRMLGQSPAGLNSTGESDIRTYYEGIKKQQKSILLTPVTIAYRCLAQSEGIMLPKDFGIEFNSLGQLTEPEKSEIHARDAETVTRLEESGIYSKPLALRELQQQSSLTGRGTNITKEDIEAAEQEGPPEPEDVEIAQIKAGAEATQRATLQ